MRGCVKVSRSFSGGAVLRLPCGRRPPHAARMPTGNMKHSATYRNANEGPALSSPKPAIRGPIEFAAEMAIA